MVFCSDEKIQQISNSGLISKSSVFIEAFVSPLETVHLSPQILSVYLSQLSNFILAHDLSDPKTKYLAYSDF